MKSFLRRAAGAAFLTLCLLSGARIARAQEFDSVSFKKLLDRLNQARAYAADKQIDPAISADQFRAAGEIAQKTLQSQYPERKMGDALDASTAHYGGSDGYLIRLAVGYSYFEAACLYGAQDAKRREQNFRSASVALRLSSDPKIGALNGAYRADLVQYMALVSRLRAYQLDDAPSEKLSDVYEWLAQAMTLKARLAKKLEGCPDIAKKILGSEDGYKNLAATVTAEFNRLPLSAALDPVSDAALQGEGQVKTITLLSHFLLPLDVTLTGATETRTVTALPNKAALLDFSIQEGPVRHLTLQTALRKPEGATKSAMQAWQMLTKTLLGAQKPMALTAQATTTITNVTLRGPQEILYFPTNWGGSVPLTITPLAGLEQRAKISWDYEVLAPSSSPRPALHPLRPAARFQRGDNVLTVRQNELPPNKIGEKYLLTARVWPDGDAAKAPDTTTATIEVGETAYNEGMAFIVAIDDYQNPDLNIYFPGLAKGPMQRDGEAIIRHLQELAKDGYNETQIFYVFGTKGKIILDPNLQAAGLDPMAKEMAATAADGSPIVSKALLDKAFAIFKEQVKRRDASHVFLFYGGHGQNVTENGQTPQDVFLLPDKNHLWADAWGDDLASSNSKLKVVGYYDACRAGKPFAQNRQSLADAYIGLQACENGLTAQYDENGGLFVAALLRKMALLNNLPGKTSFHELYYGSPRDEQGGRLPSMDEVMEAVVKERHMKAQPLPTFTGELQKKTSGIGYVAPETRAK